MIVVVSNGGSVSGCLSVAMVNVQHSMVVATWQKAAAIIMQRWRQRDTARRRIRRVHLISRRRRRRRACN